MEESKPPGAPAYVLEIPEVNSLEATLALKCCESEENRLSVTELRAISPRGGREEAPPMPSEPPVQMQLMLEQDFRSYKTLSLEALQKHLASHQQELLFQVDSWAKQQEKFTLQLIALAQAEDLVQREADRASQDCCLGSELVPTPSKMSDNFSDAPYMDVVPDQSEDRSTVLHADMTQAAKMLGIDRQHTRQKKRPKMTAKFRQGTRMVIDATSRSMQVRRTMEAVLYSKTFETLVSIIILANAIYMAYQADEDMDRVKEGKQWAIVYETQVVECAFSTFYLLEVLLRIAVLRHKFIFSHDWSWNAFDLLLVITAWYDLIMTWSGASGQGNLSFLRVMRLMKMCKLLRMIRLMRAFRELRLILNSVMSSVKSMFWAMVLILTVTFMFGICFVQATTSWLSDPGRQEVDEQTLKQLDDMWGSVAKSIFSLYVASMGGNDWEYMAKSLEHVGMAFFYLFLLYIGFFACVVTNTLTSLFVEAAMTNADKDQQQVIQAELEQKERYVNMLQNWYDALDADDSGDITLDEFMAHVHEPTMVAFAVAMDINITDVKQFFTVLSSNGRRPVDLETFIVGCIKLKGMAKSMDLMDLIYAHRQSYNDLMRLSVSCQEEFGSLNDKLKGLLAQVTEIKLAGLRGGVAEPSPTAKQRGRGRMSVAFADAEEEIPELPGQTK